MGRSLDAGRVGCSARRKSGCDDGGAAGPTPREYGADRPHKHLGTDSFGHGSQGQGSDGHGSDGHGSDGHSSDGHGSDGHGSDGLGSDATAGHGHAARTAAGDDAGDPHAHRVDAVGAGRDFSERGAVGRRRIATKPAGGPGNCRLVGTERPIAGLDLSGSD